MIPYPDFGSLELAGSVVYPFDVLVLAAVWAGAFFCRSRADVVGLSQDKMTWVLMSLLACGFIGGHWAVVLFYHPEQLLEDPLVLLYIWNGLSSYGGFFGALVFMLVFCHRTRDNGLLWCDTICYGLIHGWVLGRLGCYTAHDHPGIASDFFLAVQYPDGPRFDLGFLEMLLTIGLVVSAHGYFKKQRPAGHFTGGLAIVYGVVRFGLDFLRTEDLTYWGIWTPGHFASLATIAMGTLLILRIRQSNKTGGEA